jgi:hypothetical protein
LVEGGIVKADRLLPLQDEVNQLIAIFVTIIKKRKRNLKD